MTLVCGGRGPCCHIGYPHRHCEHCDVVVATYVQAHTHIGGYQWPQPWWNGFSGQLNTPAVWGLTGGLQQSLQGFDAQFMQGEPEK